jgi:PAS domain S-box-containing protein
VLISDPFKRDQHNKHRPQRTPEPGRLEGLVATRPKEGACATEGLKADMGEGARFGRLVRDGNQRFCSALAQAAVGVALCDITGRFLWVNQAFTEIAGYPEAELYQTNVLSITHPEDLPRVIGKIQGLLAGEINGFVVRKRYLQKSGAVVWTQNSVLAIRAPSGVVENLLALSEDITAEKQAEDALVESRRLLAEAERLAHLGSWNWDLASLRVTWSDELYRIYGLEPDASGAACQSWLERIHPEDRERVREIVGSALRSGAPFAYEKRILRPDGSVRHLYSQCEPRRNDAGEIVRMVGTCLDITERKSGEEALRSSERSLRALAARLQQVREEERTRISREIHDELGQALTGLRMDVAWLESRLPDAAEDIASKFAGMAQLIDATIRSVRRIASELRPDVLDELGLVPAIEWQVQAFQARSAVRCCLVLPETEIKIEPARATAVFRIFQEILTNIARHSRASRVNVALSTSSGDLLLTVRDDGEGIRPAQLEDSRSLGILGMRERAMEFGGTVFIGRLPRRGTQVQVRIPLGRDKGAGAPESTPARFGRAVRG